MPVDVALATNTPTGALELRQAQPLTNGIVFGAFLVVRSGGLAAGLPYFVTRRALTAFMAALRELEPAGGAARLPARQGSAFIALEMQPEGDVAVYGELEEGEQLLRFRFVTEARGVAALYDGLRDLLDLSP
jgi:hypothetical protein